MKLGDPDQHLRIHKQGALVIALGRDYEPGFPTKCYAAQCAHLA